MRPQAAPVVLTCPPPHWFLGQLTHWRTPGQCPVAGHCTSAWGPNLCSGRWSIPCPPPPARTGGETPCEGQQDPGEHWWGVRALLGSDPHPFLGRADAHSQACVFSSLLPHMAWVPLRDLTGTEEGPSSDLCFLPSPEAEARLGAGTVLPHTPNSLSKGHVFSNHPAPAGTLRRSRVPLRRTRISVSSQPSP